MTEQLNLKKNKKIKLGIISIYPPQDQKHCQFGGVAAYTKNLVTSLNKDRLEVKVYANKLNKTYSSYSEDSIDVVRCWDKGVFYPLQIWKNIIKDKPDILHIQHEFFLYGGILSIFLFLWLLFLLRISRIPTATTMHGIVPLSKISKSFVRETGVNLYSFLARFGLFVSTKAIVDLSTKVVVHENEFFKRLVEEYKCKSEKIIVIPHGIEERGDKIDSGTAKRILGFSGKKVILYFGYITGYKGIELLIDSFKILLTKYSDYILVIGGGEHPRLKEKFTYKKYLKSLEKRAKEISTSQIIFTGFLQEDKIPIYFTAADLAVFPYTVGMSSSGALMIAISYDLPFLASEVLKEIIGHSELIFKKDPRDLARKIELFFSKDNLRKKSLEYSKELKRERSWNNVGIRILEMYKTLI